MQESRGKGDGISKRRLTEGEMKWMRGRMNKEISMEMKEENRREEENTRMKREKEKGCDKTGRVKN